MQVLLVATTTGYQTRAFGDAAARLGIELVFATDRCHVLEDPWLDSAIPVRFHDIPASVARVVEAARTRPFDGVVAVGDRPAVLAAHIQEALGLPGHPPDAAAAARHKLHTRERLRDAGLHVPQFVVAPLSTDASALSGHVTYPAVLKPVSLSGSRGVMRVDSDTQLRASVDRLRALLGRPDIRSERDAAHDLVILEEFIAGHEFAVEAIMNDGQLHALAIFDKPDPLDGPFFEETIYITPPALTTTCADEIVSAVTAAARAIGLHHGPVHAECRVSDAGVFVLEAAARPIGGLCARALRFHKAGSADAIGLEELLLRHAIGERSDQWTRERVGSGVMMIPIPARGLYRGVVGVEAALDTPHVCDLQITAKPGQVLVPLPEGASYLGFIFARAADGSAVDRALRDAHAALAFTVDPQVPVLQSAHG